MWLAPLPVNRLWGVGKKTTPKLLALGLKTIADVAESDESDLRRRLGSLGSHICKLAHATDPRRVSRGRTAKSIGSDRTLSQDITHLSDIELHLRRAAERITRRVRAKNYVAYGIRIRLKINKFKMLSRQRHIIRPEDTADAFFAVSRILLDELDHSGPFRLVGMAAFDLDWREQPLQLEFFENRRRRALETAIDRLAGRFGKSVIVRARDLDQKGTIINDGMNLDFLDKRDGERVSTPR